MRVTLAFLVLGMVTVAFAAGETNNNDDVDIAAMENLLNKEKSEDDDDDTGLERSAAAEIEDDDEDRSAAGDVVEEDRRRRRRCDSRCQKKRQELRELCREFILKKYDRKCKILKSESADEYARCRKFRYRCYRSGARLWANKKC